MKRKVEIRLLAGEPKPANMIKIGDGVCFIISQNERKCQLRRLIEKKMKSPFTIVK